MVQKFSTNKNGTVNVELLCDECGGPITHSNEYGMFCDKKCGLEESKKAKAKFDLLMSKAFK